MKYVLLALIILTPTVANAGSKTISGIIDRLGIVTEQYGNVSLDVNADITGHPCATDYNYLSFDKSIPHGEHIYSMLLSAYMAGKRIRIDYSDTECGLWGTQALILRTYLD